LRTGTKEQERYLSFSFDDRRRSDTSGNH